MNRKTNRLSQGDLVNMSALIARQMLAGAMSMQFNGARDIYATLGYPSDVTFDQMYARYRRQDIAGRIVDLPAIDTWRKPPAVIDGDASTNDDQPSSGFVQAVRELVHQRRLWHYLQRVDRLSGIGRFGVLLIGTRGEMDQEIGRLNGVKDILYLAAYTEASVKRINLVEATDDPRFGLPLSYDIQMSDGLSKRVHWTRVIHVAEDLLEDEIYGRPRLERVFNRLEDLTKIVGGGSEAAWKVMDRGLHADAKEGYTFDENALAEVSDEIDEYMHGLRRFIRTKGMNINSLGSDEVNPTGLFDMLISLIAAASDIPQRLLIGSERGELASSTDQDTWAGRISARQTQFAEPMLLRELLDRLIKAGALPQPEGGQYRVEWPPLYMMSDAQRADVADKIASAIQKIAPPGAPDMVVDPDEFRERALGWPRREITPDQVLDDEDADDQGAA